MGAKIFNFFKYAFIAVLLINLTSCQVEVDTFNDNDNIGGEYYSRSSKLCSRTWASFYRNAEGYPCKQELDFYMDRTGVDYVRVEYPNGDVEVFEYKFRWNWDNYSQTSIRISYGPGDVSYFDNIYMGANTLSGYLDGNNNYVEFVGK